MMLKSKIRGAKAARTELEGDGGAALGRALRRALLDAAAMLPGKQLRVLNLGTGSRTVIYIIEAGELRNNCFSRRNGSGGKFRTTWSTRG